MLLRVQWAKRDAELCTQFVVVPPACLAVMVQFFCCHAVRAICTIISLNLNDN
jgi:hypothetical protein